jgi:hypothetical protein
MPEPEFEDSAAGQVHNERQQDDGHDYNDHPQEEHHDAGERISGDRSRSNHGHPLPIVARLIRRRASRRPRLAAGLAGPHNTIPPLDHLGHAGKADASSSGRPRELACSPGR